MTRTLVRLTIAGATAALSLGLLTGCSALGGLLSGDDTQRDPNGTVTQENNDADVFSIKVGDCANDLSGDDTSDSSNVSSVDLVPCTQAHLYEAYATQDVADASDYPGDDALTKEADDICQGAFDGFLGVSYDDSKMDYTFLYPTPDSWATGDRNVLCLMVDPDGNTITGSLKGSKK